MKHYSAIKKEIIPCAATWMDLGNVILSKTQKQKYHMTTLICRIQFFKMTQMNLFTTQKKTFGYLKQAYGYHWRNVEGGIHQELEINIYNCRVGLFVIPWTVVQQAPLSMEFPGQNTGVSFHFLLQGIFPIREHASLVSPPLAGGFFTIAPPGKSTYTTIYTRDIQKGPTVQQRELYSIFCNKLYEKRI